MGPQIHMFACFAPAMQDTHGNEYLKISATHHAINKLVGGKSSKNASMANNDNLQQLKKQRNEAVEGPEDAWGGDGEEVEPPEKKQKVSEEAIVHIKVGETDVAVMCPAKRSSTSDLLVQLDPTMLEAVFVFLKDGPNEAKPARAYNKTGKYSKAGGKEAEPPEEEKK